METDSDQFVYLIDTYDKYFKQGNEVYLFTFNEVPYCVRKTKLEWGLPILQYLKIDENPPDPALFCIYNTLDDALQFIQLMRRLNSWMFDFNYNLHYTISVLKEQNFSRWVCYITKPNL